MRFYILISSHRQIKHSKHSRELADSILREKDKKSSDFLKKSVIEITKNFKKSDDFYKILSFL